MTGLAERREKREEGGGRRVSLFTLQEKSQRGVEDAQSPAQPACQDDTLNTLISPLIAAWKYMVLGRERENPEIMSARTTRRGRPARLCRSKLHC